MGKTQLIYSDFKKVHSATQDGLYLIGFGFDGTACFRKGTKLGPDAVRTASPGIETYSPYLDLDLEDFETKLFDLGNIPLEKSDDANTVWKSGTDYFNTMFNSKDLDKIKILTIGGEHSISYAPIKLYLDKYDDLCLIQLDAHADLRDGYEGYHFSHASIMRRSLDHFRKEHKLIQYGIRSGTKEEYSWMKENKTLCMSLENFLEEVNELPSSRPIYLTFDLDYFDPGFFPGTGTPEPGGEDFHSFVKLMKILQKKNLVGADVVELAPELDSSGCSDIYAAKVVREIALTLVNNV